MHHHSETQKDRCLDEVCENLGSNNMLTIRNLII